MFDCVGWNAVVLTGDYLLYAGPLDCALLVGQLRGYQRSYFADKKRVLINAFTVRALRDTFPPARGAGIMALCATSSYYDITEVVTQILPNVVVLTIDPNRLYLTMSLYSL
ncbi:N-terminal kinase-like protein [Glycine soja]